MILFLLSLLFIQGCARPALQTYPASEQEIESAVAAFVRYRKASEEVCPCCLDAEADAALLVSGWFSDHTGKLSGYLQAMEPGYVKFIAINPLGQPLLIFVTDGNIFKSLNIFEGKAYLGSAGSETYRNFAPQGFEPRFSYYWLTGRLVPGDMRIQAVMHDSEQGKFWLQIKYANSSTESMVLFDPREFLILRHVLRDERGVHLMDVRYADYQPRTGAESKVAGNGSAGVSGPDGAGVLCRVPAGITVSTNGGAEKIEVILSSFLDEPRFSTEDFDVEIPDNFEQLRAK
jgi:hypothetical protein